eukprot:1102939-Amphidinium_carterae.1
MMSSFGSGWVPSALGCRHTKRMLAKSTREGTQSKPVFDRFRVAAFVAWGFRYRRTQGVEILAIVLTV